MERRASFGYWMRRRRKALDLTQHELAQLVGCALGTIQKLEADERRPSKQLATRLAELLQIPAAERADFIKAARAELAADQLALDEPALEFAPSRSQAHPPSNLPIPTTPFIGREREAATLRDLLRHHDVRLVTVSGPGGTGKTRLSLHVAAELHDWFEHGVWFINLAPIGDPGLVASIIAQVLGVREIGEQPIVELLKHSLREKRTLLLLDNFEQVVDAAPIISELLAYAPGLKVLATSRTTLRLSGEREFAVPPLGLPPASAMLDERAYGRPTADHESLSMQAITQYEAVRLFIERAQAVKADFAVTNQNAPAVAEICYRLDGLPLAIELAAARIKLFPPQALLERLGSRLSFLVGGARDLPARQQTIRNTIDWSYHLLGEGEATLFARLGVFVGGCTLEAAEAVGHADRALSLDVLKEIAALVDQSLLRQNAEPNQAPRLVMLETIREYALEQLGRRSEAAALQRWHAEYFVALAEQAEPELVGPHQVAWLDRLERDLDNLRAALAWSLEHGEIELGLRLAGALSAFWYTRSHWNEGRRWFKAALARGTGATRASRAKALLGAGQLATFQNDYAPAFALCEQARTLYLELGDRWGMAWALFFQTIIAAQDLANPARSNVLAAESLALRRSIGDKRGIAYSLHLEGEGALYGGEFARAIQLYDESLALFREVGDTYGISLSLAMTAEAAYATGDYERAERLSHECLKANDELGDRRGSGTTLELLGRLAYAQGQEGAARTLFAQALALLGDAGDRWALARCIESIAALRAASDAGRAATLFGFAAKLRQSIGTPQTHLDRARCAQAIATARAQLDGPTFETAWAAGQSLTLAQALHASFD